MQPGRGRRRFTGVIGKALAWSALLAGLLATGAAHAAEEPITIESIRVGFQDRFKPGTWTPVWVDLKAGSANFNGVVEVVVTDDDGTPTAFRREFSAPARGEIVQVSTYARPGRHDVDFIVRVYDAATGRMAASRTFNNVEPLNRGQTLLLTIGRVSGVDQVPGVAVTGPEAPVTSAVGGQIMVVPLRVPGGIPARWYGYEAAEVVVLNTNQQEALEALNAGRGEALKAWVRNGGHLVVTIGEKWQTVLGSVLEPLLPALPSGRERLNDLGTLESFAKSSRPIVPVGEKAMLVTTLDPVEARGGRDIGTSNLVVRGHYGFGRVTVVGLDVDQRPFSDWPDRKDFWVKVLDLGRRAGEGETSNSNTVAVSGFYQSQVFDVGGALHQSMEQFAGVRLVPFGYVAFFVFLYILLIGPGDYFFLKKVVKRMELTWVTFPLIVVTVSTLAYAAAFAVKGTELKVNKVDALDVDQTTGLVRGSTYFTIFSPQNRDYDLSVAPVPTDREAPSPIAAESDKRAAGVETLVSWFGAPEGPLGGPGGSGGGLSLSAGSYAYEPMGEPRTLQGVRVPIWTTKAFRGRWFGVAGAAVVDADLSNSGDERLAGTITNRLPRALRNTLLIRGTRYYDLGELKPGQTKAIGELNPSTLSTKIDGILQRLPGTSANRSGDQPPPDTSGMARRAEFVFAAMFRDAGTITGSPVGNLTTHDLDLSGQLALDRPMLVAEVDGPAATIGLGKITSVPKVEQTTVIRVILPPEK